MSVTDVTARLYSKAREANRNSDLVDGAGKHQLAAFEKGVAAGIRIAADEMVAAQVRGEFQ